MTKIIGKMTFHSLKELIAVILVNLLGFTTICVFLAFSSEVSGVMDSVNTMYSNAESIQVFLSALLAVCVLVIVFAQWICAVAYRALFDQRKDFNVQLRLEGASSGKLVRIYTMEALLLQLLVIPLGVVLSSVLFGKMAEMYEMAVQEITVAQFLIGIVTHLVVNQAVVYLVLRKLSRFNVVNMMRSEELYGKAKKIGKNELIQAGLGVLLIALSRTVANMFGASNENFRDGIHMVLMLVGAFMAFDTVYILLHELFAFLALKLRLKTLYLAHKNILGYYEKIQSIIILFSIGIMVFVGLNGMFLYIRSISAATVDQNLYFSSLVVHSNYSGYTAAEDFAALIDEAAPGTGHCEALSLVAQDKEDIRNTITGVESNYAVYGEKFVVSEGQYTVTDFDDPDWNGIVLPDYLITSDRIGSEFSINLMGQDVTFTIMGTFRSNGTRGRYGFVSLSYLQNTLGVPGMVNAVYLASADESLLGRIEAMPGVKESTVYTKESIKETSYKKSITGTEMLTTASYSVALCALMMLLSFIVLFKRQNVNDMIRVRSIGKSKSFAFRIYLAQMLIIILHGFAIGIPLSYVFINVGTKLTVEYIDVVVEPTISYATIAVSLCACIVSVGLVLAVSLKRGLTKEYYEQLRQNSV